MVQQQKTPLKIGTTKVFRKDMEKLAKQQGGEKSNKDEIDNVYLAGVNMYQVIKKEKDLEILLERTEVDLKTALAS